MHGDIGIEQDSVFGSWKNGGEYEVTISEQWITVVRLACPLCVY